MPLLSTSLSHPQVLMFYATLAFAAILAVVAGVFYFLKAKAERTLVQVQGRVLAAEARAAEHQRTLHSPQQGLHTAHARKQSSPKKKGTLEEGSAAQGSSQELLQLRRDLAHVRDETKKLREQLRLRENEIKNAKETEDSHLFALREENKRLLEQLREADKKMQAQGSNRAAHTELQQSEAVKRLEAALEGARAQAVLAAEKVRGGEQESRRLREALKNTEGRLEKMNASTLDPRTLVRWRDRALEGRKMYRLMRQMRELSDDKLASYQAAVTQLSRYVLEQKHQELPEVKAGELAPDVYLAHAWAVVLETLDAGPQN